MHVPVIETNGHLAARALVEERLDGGQNPGFARFNIEVFPVAQEFAHLQNAVYFFRTIFPGRGSDQHIVVVPRDYGMRLERMVEE